MSEEAARRARKRRLERHASATIRALSGEPRAEYRNRRLLLAERAVPVGSPHLAVDAAEHSGERIRGAADALALRLRFSDRALHRRLSPKSPLPRLVFEILEQLRVEALVPASLPGVRGNLDTAFNQWCREARAAGMVENEIGLLVYSVTQIVRARLLMALQDEEVEGLIEASRFRLAPLIGGHLAALRRLVGDQAGYAEHAAAIAEIIDEIASGQLDGAADTATAAARVSFLSPFGWSEGEESAELGGAASGAAPLAAGDPLDDYRVFSRAYDIECRGTDLYPMRYLAPLRKELDGLIAAQAVSVPRLARRLQRIFATPQRAGWHFGEEEGLLDARALSQLVANPDYRQVFRRERHSPHSDVVLSFLVDNSGSMKRQRFETVAILLDIWCRALELAGVRSEVLGFTTAEWSGGRALQDYRRAATADEPEPPGRLNATQHVIYKDADTPYRRARPAIAAMLRTLHFREGVDGEALAWAYERLRRRSEPRRVLVMLSDGAPMDTATLQYNGEDYLDRHLRAVARMIERRGEVQLGAIGIGLDMREYFVRSLSLDLTGTLDGRAFNALEALFAGAPPG